MSETESWLCKKMSSVHKVIHLQLYQRPINHSTRRTIGPSHNTFTCEQSDANFQWKHCGERDLLIKNEPLQRDSLLFSTGRRNLNGSACATERIVSSGLLIRATNLPAIMEPHSLLLTCATVCVRATGGVMNAWRRSQTSQLASARNVNNKKKN